MPVHYLFLDEADGYPRGVEGEGDAIQLAEARTRTFARHKIFIVSTPTISSASRIEREYEQSDQRRYFVPCPYCGHRQWLRFEQLRWSWGNPDSARYVCESCSGEIPEHHKAWMLEHGQWQATLPENAGKTARFPVREWQKLRERNEGLDCYVYSRAAASAAGLDRFEERHWGKLEKQLGIAEAIPGAGLAVSGYQNPLRRVIKSRWLGG